jgi:hypothetical protein
MSLITFNCISYYLIYSKFFFKIVLNLKILITEINRIFPDQISIYVHLLISINQNMILLIFLTSILCHDKLVWTNYFLIIMGTLTLKRKVEDRNGYYKDYDKVKRSRQFSKSWQTIDHLNLKSPYFTATTVPQWC